MQPQQQPLQLGILIYELQVPSGSHDLRIAAGSPIFANAISVEQHKPGAYVSPTGAPRQVATRFLDDRRSVPSASCPDIQAQVQALIFPTAFEESCEGTVALSLNPYENDTPGLYQAATPHRFQPIFGIPPSTPARYLG